MKRGPGTMRAGRGGGLVTKPIAWDRLRSPVLLAGSAERAYRDPAAVYHDGVFHLYATVADRDARGLVCLRTAWSRSADLVHWTVPRCFTPRDRTLNFSSPGNVVADGPDFVLCLQTYPTPRPEDKYGDRTSRIWTVRSRDLEHWGAPELLRVAGPDVPPERMPRLIDPYLLADKDTPGKWWCFYKQDGQVGYAWSRDLRRWTPAGVGAVGENPCVVVDGDEYVLFYSPANGIGVKRSRDLATWRRRGP